MSALGSCPLAQRQGEKIGIVRLVAAGHGAGRNHARKVASFKGSLRRLISQPATEGMATLGMSGAPPSGSSGKAPRASRAPPARLEDEPPPAPTRAESVVRARARWVASLDARHHVLHRLAYRVLRRPRDAVSSAAVALLPP